MPTANTYRVEEQGLLLAESEYLLAQSQKDNKEKHEALESYKIYVKELEKLLEASCGPAWRVDHGVTPLASSAPINNASTPLPKPAPTPLRYSTSVSLSNKRSSCIVHRQTSQQLDLRHLDSLREVSENVSDSTPTGAMRRLIGAEASKPLASSAAVKSVDHVKAIQTLLEEMEKSLSRKEGIVKSMSQAAQTQRIKFELIQRR